MQSTCMLLSASYMLKTLLPNRQHAHKQCFFIRHVHAHDSTAFTGLVLQCACSSIHQHETGCCVSVVVTSLRSRRADASVPTEAARRSPAVGGTPVVTLTARRGLREVHAAPAGPAIHLALRGTTSGQQGAVAATGSLPGRPAAMSAGKQIALCTSPAHWCGTASARSQINPAQSSAYWLQLQRRHLNDAAAVAEQPESVRILASVNGGAAGTGRALRHGLPCKATGSIISQCRNGLLSRAYLGKTQHCGSRAYDKKAWPGCAGSASHLMSTCWPKDITCLLRYDTAYLLVRRAECPDEVPTLPRAGAGVRRQVVRPAMDTEAGQLSTLLCTSNPVTGAPCAA